MSVSAERASMSTVKLALLANQVRTALADADALAAEPIAIIGIGCRYPGDANSPDEYWRIIRDGVDAISEVPADRWDADEFYDRDPYTPGRMNTRWGGFVRDLDRFDAAYFGISPREAARMDPQQRMLMEVAIEALERGGQRIDDLMGTQAGVFVASTMLDYGEREHIGAIDIDAYSVTGNFHCFIPNRLSFTLDLRGPSVSVDTACSSSLVAVHLACQSLRNRDSDLALAGGVNALLSPTPSVGLSKWGLMAPDGRCKTLDARADGFVRSEGCGVVVLKRLADAITDNDPVVAVIRGSAVNQDGRSTAMTAPNGLAQQAVIRRALATAQVLPEQVGLVEMHGTGTVLGDPIEVEALVGVLGEQVEGAPPLALSAVKTNIGHLEAAAGIAGLIKAVLCMQHGLVPPPVHLENLNPHISLEHSRLFVPTATYHWPAGSTRRIAGVSSFGFGGTNAHVLVEEAPTMPSPTLDSGPPLLLLSGQSPEALREMARVVAEQLESSDPDTLDAINLDAINATAATRRTHHHERLAVVADVQQDLVERLRGFVEGERSATVAHGRTEPGRRRRVAFVCSGQGNQWWGMARDLIADSSAFRTVIEQCDELLRERVTWSLLEELARSEDESRLELTEFAQPALFAIQVALAELWRSWGIVPDALVGHSVGEVAAAHLAGALSLRDAIRVIADRGSSMQHTVGTGAMASVEWPAVDVARVIAEQGDQVSIAAINAPDVTVVSGEVAAVTQVVDALAEQGAAVRTLGVAYPFHSKQMVGPGRALVSALDGLTSTSPRVRLASTVTGSWVDAVDAEYWGSNVTEPVRFAEAIDVMAGWGCDTFIELGPHPVLGGAIHRTIGASDSSTDAVVVASLRRGRPDAETMATALGQLHCAGLEVDWRAVWPGRRTMASLPTYRWQRRRYWSDTWQPAGGPRPSSGVKRFGRADAGAVVHPLLGDRLRSPAIDGAVYESELGAGDVAIIDDHRIGELALMPATGFVEMAAAAFRTAVSRPATTLRCFEVPLALAFDEDQQTIVQTHVREGADGSTVSISSTHDGETWTEHARGDVSDDPVSIPAIDIDALRRRCDAEVTGTDLYARLRRRNVNFGATFLGVSETWSGDREVVARIEAPAVLLDDTDRYVFHPALLDSAIHPIALMFPTEEATFLPVAFDLLRVAGRPGAELWSHVRLRGDASDAVLTVDITVADRDGEVIADLTGLRLVRADAESVAAGIGRSIQRDRADRSESDVLFEVAWRRATSTADLAVDPGPWLVITDGAGVGTSAAELLDHLGASVDLIGEGVALTAETIGATIRDRGATDVVYLRGLDAPVPDVDVTTTQTLVLSEAIAMARGCSDTGARLWIVTSGAAAVDAAPTAPEQASLLGLGAAIASERPELRCVRLDLDPTESPGERAQGLVAALAAVDDQEDVVAYRRGERHVARLTPAATRSTVGPKRLASESYGVLDGLFEAPLQRREPADDEVEVQVAVSGLNFRDVLLALDVYPERSELFGDECAGIVTQIGSAVDHLAVGDRVLAIAPGSMATHVTLPADCAHRIPDTLTFDDAATIPVAFLTAHYALVELGHLAAGERVLIHAGAGGVGMAAIQIAQRVGAEIYATAGSDEKRTGLAALGVEHVFDSRSLDFADEVLRATDGEGVHVVLNSLADDFIQRSVDVLADAGRFLEIGRREVWSIDKMATERPDVDYHIVFLGDVSMGDPPRIRAMFDEMLPRFGADELRPLPTTCFDAVDAVDAFRFMAQARHTGKIVIRQHTGVSAAGTYLVTGGLGGIGLVIARHLVDLGARSIALVGRTGPSEHATVAIDRLRDLGADVRVFRADVSMRGEIVKVLDEIDATAAPLRGIVHAAGVTDDALLDDQDPERIERVLAPKVGGAWHLHTSTAEHHLDMFVLMSAVSPVLGAPAQAGYVAANAFLDALAGVRQDAGLAGLSIGWGAWDRLGMTERIEDVDRDRMARRGILPLDADDAIAAFDEALAHASIGTSHVVVASLDRRMLGDRPIVSELVASSTPTSTRSPAASIDVMHDWIATVPGRRRSMISTFVEDQARTVLGLSSSVPIPSRQPLNEIGLDSLMAVELRNAIGTAIGRTQPATLLFDHPTSESLVEYLLAATETHDARPSGDSVDISSPTTPAAAIDDLGVIADLTDEEAEALLLAELGAHDDVGGSS